MLRPISRLSLRVKLIYMQVSLEAAALLAALTHPNHLGCSDCYLVAIPVVLGIGSLLS